MKPFLRPTDRGRLAPVGWVAEPAGRWAGKEVDVVYDPRRHEVLMVRNDVGDTTRTEFGGAGYRRLAVDGKQEMWVRDRVEATVVALDHIRQGRGGAPAAEVGGRGL